MSLLLYSGITTEIFISLKAVNNADQGKEIIGEINSVLQDIICVHEHQETDKQG